MKKQVSEKIIKEVIGGIVELARKEREADPEYKALWDKNDLENVLRDAEGKMMDIALNVAQILENKYGLTISNNKWEFITALPMIMSKLEKHIEKEEGMSCCVDKAYYIAAKILQKRT